MRHRSWWKIGLRWLPARAGRGGIALVAALFFATGFGACLGDDGGNAPICGDGYCDLGESAVDCPTDCAYGCLATDFECGADECIPPADVCDGVADCSNGADEDPGLCAGCEPEQFDCGDGVCLSAAETCDGTAQCASGADEDPALCGAGCPLGDWACDSGECIAEGFVCDGDRDCGDGSDEDPGLCASCVPLRSYLCEDGVDIVPLAALCDGVSDCIDGSDEVYCAPCAAGETPCPASGYCVPDEWICDGYNDCGDCADETGC